MASVSFILAAVLLSIANVQGEDHWAVLVAGSNGYYNYRHQADVCHAYQLMIKNGFDPSKIITMLYDDVANSNENPYKGKLFNRPAASLDQAVDVYAGCKKDYVGKDVNPDKFLAVLTGDKSKAGGKVLESTSSDHVFVNFVDHGAVGLIAFPDEAEVLHATPLINALKQMYAKGLFGKLTFYLETCESGSMFEGLLPSDLPVYAVTAANSHESSFGTYCGEDAKVGGKSLDTCLGDLFSVNWMQDSEHNMRETLKQQFESVKNETSKSHVMQYGQVKTFDSLPLGEFQAGSGSSLSAAVSPREPMATPSGSLDARDVHLHMLYGMYMKKQTRQVGSALVKEISDRSAARDRSVQIASAVLGSEELALSLIDAPDKTGPIDWTYVACHETAVAKFGESCGWTTKSLTTSKVLHRLCSRTSGKATPIAAAIMEVCSSPSSDLVV